MIKIILLLLVSFTVTAAEQPEYLVLEKIGDLEIRQYPPHIVAETLVQGEFDEVGSSAFRRLAGYIFGKNEADKKISMTAPVTQQQTGEGYIVRFYMPAEHNLSDLPAPLDDTVSIREASGGTFAVLKYKGGWKQKRYLKHKDRLIEQLTENPDWRINGEPTWARYNAPIMPAFLRVNEILIPVESK